MDKDQIAKLMGPNELELRRQIYQGWVPDAEYVVRKGGDLAWEVFYEIVTERDALRDRVAELENQLAEETRWYPISEAHKDHGHCAFIDILDPNDKPDVASVLDYDFEDLREVCAWTHFKPIRLSIQQAERLLEEVGAAMTNEENE